MDGPLVVLSIIYFYARKKTVNGNDQNPTIQSHGNEPKLLDNEVNNNLFVTSKKRNHEFSNSPIHDVLQNVF